MRAFITRFYMRLICVIYTQRWLCPGSRLVIQDRQVGSGLVLRLALECDDREGVKHDMGAVRDRDSPGSTDAGVQSEQPAT